MKIKEKDGQVYDPNINFMNRNLFFILLVSNNNDEEKVYTY